MPHYELPRRSETPPVATASYDRALAAELLADPHKLVAYVEVLPSVCADLQRAVCRGTWYSRKRLVAVQKQAQAVLRASRYMREVSPRDLRNLDAIAAFVNGVEVPTPQARS